jgi:DNA-binding MarR family transcriptional regulator
MKPDPLPEGTLDSLQRLMRVIEAFRALKRTMPAQYIHTFSLIARNEGLSVVEYAERANVSVSVMSRHILDIGDYARNRSNGFGLVTSRPNPMELRKHEVWLTAKGKALAHKIDRIIRTSSPNQVDALDAHSWQLDDAAT